LYSQPVSLIGVVVDQPALGEKSVKLKIKPEAKHSKILVTVWKYPAYEYGDRLKITGTLEEPLVFEDFNYKAFLAKDGIYSVMYFPKTELLGKDFGSFVMKYLFSFKSLLNDSLNKIMPQPHSGLMAGLMFGDEQELSQGWKDKFNFTGTRHITAVSGMNITIISALALNFLLALGFWRRQAFYLSVVMIIMFVLLIGAPSSALRAAIMGIILLSAQQAGRYSSGFRTLVLAGALMLLVNPLLLKSDIGFQLSFMATLGLIVLQPILFDLFNKISERFQLRYTLAATFSAQIFVLPILIYNFGQIPLIGPLANLFIVPLLAPITVLGFISSLLGVFSEFIGQIFSFPAWLGLEYIFKTVDFTSTFPYATLRISNAHWLLIPVTYLLLAFLIVRVQEKNKLKFLIG
jgi:competence protein ComEC